MSKLLQKIASQPIALFLGIVLVLGFGREFYTKAHSAPMYFFAIESVSFIIACLYALLNYERLMGKIRDLYQDHGQIELIGFYKYPLSCVALFVACLIALLYEQVILVTWLLVILYIIYCYSNKSTMDILNIGGVMDQKKKQYYSLIADTITVANTENIPGLYGYVILAVFNTAFTFIIWWLGQNPTITDLLKVYVAGAATVHLAMSSASFARVLEFSADDHKSDVVETIISNIDLAGNSGQTMIRAITQAAAEAGKKIASSVRKAVVLGIVAVVILVFGTVQLRRGYFVEGLAGFGTTCIVSCAYSEVV